MGRPLIRHFSTGSGSCAFFGPQLWTDHSTTSYRSWVLALGHHPANIAQRKDLAS